MNLPSNNPYVTDPATLVAAPLLLLQLAENHVRRYGPNKAEGAIARALKEVIDAPVIVKPAPWTDAATAPEAEDIWLFLPPPTTASHLPGTIELGSREGDDWYDAEGTPIRAPILWAPSHKPPHPVTGK